MQQVPFTSNIVVFLAYQLNGSSLDEMLCGLGSSVSDSKQPSSLLVDARLSQNLLSHPESRGALLILRVTVNGCGAATQRVNLCLRSPIVLEL